MARMSMGIKVTSGTMAGLAIAAVSRTKRRISGRGISGAGGGIMAGGTGIMNFVVGRVNRGGHSSALNQSVGVASNAIDVVVNPSSVVSLDMVDEVGVMTGVTVAAANRTTRGLSGHIIGGNSRANESMTG